MTRYSNDPRQISAKFSSNCSKCNTKIKKGATFITSHRHVKCIAYVVVMHLTVSFSQVLLMKMSIMVQVIRMPSKLKEGEIPFLVVGRR